jgi:hypothetical protein
MAVVWKFHVISDKFNMDRICTSVNYVYRNCIIIRLYILLASLFRLKHLKENKHCKFLCLWLTSPDIHYMGMVVTDFVYSMYC